MQINIANKFAQFSFSMYFCKLKNVNKTYGNKRNDKPTDA